MIWIGLLSFIFLLPGEPSWWQGPKMLASKFPPHPFSYTFECQLVFASWVYLHMILKDKFLSLWLCFVLLCFFSGEQDLRNYSYFAVASHLWMWRKKFSWSISDFSMLHSDPWRPDCGVCSCTNISLLMLEELSYPRILTTVLWRKYLNSLY